MINPPSLTCS